ncbi:hypothetical protein NXV57_32360 [Bacteroides thetaiotaomicron]|nr:hypothetical protein [Bacteroides thetaiotaomicron]
MNKKNREANFETLFPVLKCLSSFKPRSKNEVSTYKYKIMNRINANKKPDKMIILLFFSILSLTAISQNAEKKITIQNKNISLKEAFEQIELQTDYSIAYEQSNLNLKKEASIVAKVRKH